MGRRRSGGLWCWSCQRQLPNERFSGRGHARHLCRVCSSIPTEELEFRQVILDIERILSRAGKWKKKRLHLERFREHPDERVRRFLADVIQPPEQGEEEPEWELEDEGRWQAFDEAAPSLPFDDEIPI